MPVASVWMLEESNITVSGGVSLDGITQGDGSHLIGRTITLNTAAWRETFINDNDADFDDNDGNQTLVGSQTIDGITYASGTRVEAEYRLILQNPVSGQTWVVIGYNVNNSNPTFGTIEGLAFIGPPAGWPPVGTPLIVVGATEGPGSAGQATTSYGSYVAPPCFTPGTRIQTDRGPKRIELLQQGDRIQTRDAGFQPLLYVSRTHLSRSRLLREPNNLPVRIRAQNGAVSAETRDLVVSPNHRILWSGSSCDLHFGTPEVLVAAADLETGHRLQLADCPFGVTYLHLIFETHQVIWADGMWSESFLVGPSVFAGAPAQVQADLLDLFPDLGHHRGASWHQSARLCIRSWEARALVA